MILENGVIRTLDESLPSARALAIAGDRVAGGVGPHETALASPERRRPRRPLRPARVHGQPRPLPDLVAGPGRRAARRRRLARGGARPRPARRTAERWVRGTRLARRRLGRQPPTARGARRGHRRDPGGALVEGLPLALAQLGRARARRRRPRRRGRGRRARRPDGEPTGVLREESAWRFRERHVDGDRGRVGRGDARAASGSRTRRGRGGDPRQGRLARRAGDLPADRSARRAHAARLAVAAARAGRRARRRSGCARGSATTSCGSAT